MVGFVFVFFGCCWLLACSDSLIRDQSNKYYFENLTHTGKDRNEIPQDVNCGGTGGDAFGIYFPTVFKSFSN